MEQLGEKLSAKKQKYRAHQAGPTGHMLTYDCGTCTKLFSIVDISQQKVRFDCGMNYSANKCLGSSDTNETYFTFVRIGDL